MKKKNVSRLKLDSAFGKNAGAELWTLKILHDRHWFSMAARSLANVLNQAPMKLVSPVAEVQARHIHSGFDQLADLLQSRSGGAQGTDDFYFSKICVG
jgi:hypothetical protein